METEDVRSSFLATTVHLKDGIEISTSDQDAAQAVKAWPAGCEGRQHPPGLRIRMEHIP